MVAFRAVVFVPSWLCRSTRLRQAFWWRGSANGVRPSGRVVPWSAAARGPAKRLGLTSRSTGLPAAAGELYVGRSRGKARESSLRSRPSASSSGEAAALRSASGGSVAGADAVAPLAVVPVLRPHWWARLQRGAIGRVLARGLVAFPVSSGYPLDYSPNPALQGTLRDKAAQRP